MTFVPVKDDGSPRDGKAAIGTIGPGGLFVLTTYEKDDGAILGKHRIVYSPPEEGLSEEEEEADVVVNENGEEIATPTEAEPQGIEFQLQVPESKSIVEVKDQENSFLIMLDKSRNEEEEEEE